MAASVKVVPRESAVEDDDTDDVAGDEGAPERAGQEQDHAESLRIRGRKYGSLLFDCLISLAYYHVEFMW